MNLEGVASDAAEVNGRDEVQHHPHWKTKYRTRLFPVNMRQPSQ